MAEIDITNDLAQVNTQLEDYVGQLNTLNTQREQLTQQIHNLNGIAMYLRGKEESPTVDTGGITVEEEFPPPEGE
jgi:peptidoglycan hydrolase CwlO-like protein